MNLLEEVGIPELTSKQIEEIGKVAEEEVRKYVFSRVPQKQIERLDIVVEVEGARPILLTVNVDVKLSSRIKNIDEQRLADEAADSGLNVAREFLRKLVCQLQK